jgi:hypothetical protein
MLANVLAVLLGIGSFTFYLAAFLYPEVHRRSDWVWSGLGVLYAADLWFSAKQMTPIVLLGQMASVILLVGLGWQTLSVRREKTPVYQQTPIVLTPEVVGDWAKSQLNQLRIAPVETVRPATLKDRPVMGPSTDRLRQGLNQSLDPRRRPLYDYEFVEDGVLESAVEVSETLAEALETAAVEAEPIDPPSAIAEVLTVEANEITQSSSLQPTEDDSEANEPKVIKPEADKPEALESEAVESEIFKLETANPNALELETSQAELSKADNPGSKDLKRADNDWGDELELYLEGPRSDKPELIRAQPTTAQVETSKLETSKLETSEPLTQPKRKPLREKPSLLAVPGIFISWIKDVAQSLTKPKPSKPVIDIPRREAPSTEADNADSNWDDSDWDNSNWID